MKSNSLFSSKAIRKILRIAFCVGCLLTIVSTTTAQTTIFSETFEGSFPNTWYIGNDGGIGGYMWGNNSYRYYAGSWSGFCSDSSNGGLNSANTYKNNLHTYMEKRSVSFASFTSCSLKFRYWCKTEAAFDYFTVCVRNQSGSWSEHFRVSGDSSAVGWRYKAINLSQFAGQTGLIIQFRFDSDGSYIPASPAGVWVDEIYCIGRTSTNADLAMSNLSFSPTPIYAGANPTAVSYRVTNNGPANLASPNTRVLVDYYLSTNTTWSTSDTWFGSTGMDLTINSGSYYNVNLSPTGLSYLTIPAGQTPGLYYVFAKIQHSSPSVLVDPTSTNDYTMRVGTITVIANADLAMSLLSFSPTTITHGVLHPTAVSYRVTNNGPANLASPNTRVLVDYYLSTNTTWSTSDTWFGSTGMDLTINSGSYYNVNLSPTGLSYLWLNVVPDGYYYVFAKIQHTTPSYLVDPTPGNDYTMCGPVQVTGVEGSPDQIITPKVFAFSGIYPNPSKGYAELKYQLPQQEIVTINVYDISGRVVRSLNVGNKMAGFHSYKWNGVCDNGQKVAAGIYLVKLIAGSTSQKRKMVVAK